MRIEFTVPAVPRPQPRQRHRNITTKAGKSFTHNYTPTKDPVNAFKAAVQIAASQAYQGPPLDGPLRVSLVLVFPRPKGMLWKTKPMPRIWHTITPDRDNVMKSFQDALNKTLFLDDSQICAGPVEKYVASGYEQPHVHVVIETLEEPVATKADEPL